MTFTIYPAIDLRGGQVVRLCQGDPGAVLRYGDDPTVVARRWADEGAEWLHVVNLDGAFEFPIALLPDGPGKNAGADRNRGFGRSRGLTARPPKGSIPAAAQKCSMLAPGARALPINLRRLAEIRAAVALPIQFGGGLRSAEDVARAFDLGATRVVLGTVAVRQPQVVAQALARWGADRIVVGVDARAGRVAIHGWQESAGLTALAVARRMADLGVQRIIYTDIARDGMLAGVNLAATAELARLSGLSVIASGGAAGLADIVALSGEAGRGIEGVIVGQALYTGVLRLPAALSAARRAVPAKTGS